MDEKSGMTKLMSVALTPGERAKLRRLAGSMGVKESTYLRVLAQALHFKPVKTVSGKRYERLEVNRW